MPATIKTPSNSTNATTPDSIGIPSLFTNSSSSHAAAEILLGIITISISPTHSAPSTTISNNFQKLRMPRLMPHIRANAGIANRFS